MMAIFVHLDDTDPSNGGLGIFPGSHLKGPQVNNPSLTLNLDCVHVSVSRDKNIISVPPCFTIDHDHDPRLL